MISDKFAKQMWLLLERNRIDYEDLNILIPAIKEKCQEKGWNLGFDSIYWSDERDGEHHCGITSCEDTRCKSCNAMSQDISVSVYMNVKEYTLAETICRAFVEAMGEEPIDDQDMDPIEKINRILGS